MLMTGNHRSLAPLSQGELHNAATDVIGVVFKGGSHEWCDIDIVGLWREGKKRACPLQN